MIENTQKKVLVFGTFDGIHKGHVHFLNEAKKLGRLYVSVATDIVTKQLKDHLPLHDEKARQKMVKDLEIAEQVLIGEKEINSWKTLKTIRPDIIALGYDQRHLKKVLTPLSKELQFKIKTIKSFEPKKYHSKFLNK